MKTSKKLTQAIEAQDVKTLTMMVQNGTKLNELKLFDVLANFINNENKVNARFIKLLVSNGIDIGKISKTMRNSTLMLLAYLGVDEVIEDFISKGFDINAQNTYGMNAFHWAVAGGQYSTVKMLHDKGADIYEKVKFEVSYYEKKHAGTLSLDFLDKEPQIKIIELTSFALAFNKYNSKIVEFLLNNSFDPNENVIRKNNFFAILQDKIPSSYIIENSAIEEICKNNDVKLLKLMIEKGANCFKTVHLAQACKNLNFELIKLLVKQGVEINYEHGFGIDFDNMLGNPLSIVCAHSAIEPTHGNCASKLDIHGSEVFEIIKYLLNHGADVNIDSALMAACSFNYPYGSVSGDENQFYADINIDIIKLLIEKGANINYINYEGKSILMEAVNRHNCLELANILIDYGADINHKDNSGNSVLMNIKLDPDLSELFGTEESELNEYDGYDDVKKTQKTIKLLIEKGADLNIKNNMGFTVLMKYSFENYKSLVQILIENGADINVKSEMTAYDLTNKEDIRKIITRNVNHHPQKLVKLLENFTIDTPIKCTVHQWEASCEDCKKMDFDDFIDKVQKQWDSIKDELKELSPSLHVKIEAFLFAKSKEEWCKDTGLDVGWSNLDGLKEHCKNGGKPFEFVLEKPISLENETIATFKEVIKRFKEKIEIRNDSNMLEDIFSNFEEQLNNNEMSCDTCSSIKGVDFYTDVEKFVSALELIFTGIIAKKGGDDIVEIKLKKPNTESVEIHIIHKDSFSNRTEEEMLNEVNDGDFKEIKENLTNLCDWSVEDKFEEKSYRVNYLKSNNIKDIEELESKITGFTHILRFYK